MVSTYTAVGMAVVFLGIGVVLGWVIRSIFELAIIDVLREKCAEYRRKIAKMSRKRMDEVQDEADRHAACEIQIGELKKQLKAANVIKDGWRSAADRGRGK